MKKIAVVSFNLATSEFYGNLIKEFFSEYAQIDIYYFEDVNIERGIEADLVVVSSHIVYSAVKKYVICNSEIIVARCTIFQEIIDKLLELPIGTKAMLVNISPGAAVETISILHQLGVNNIELTPVYPRIEETPDIDLAISSNASEYIPNNVKEVIEIGDKVLGITTITDIANKLELTQVLDEPIVIKYFKEVASGSFTSEKVLERTKQLENEADILFGALDEGIIGISPKGTIYSFNESAEEFTGYKSNDTIGRSAYTLFPQIPFAKVQDTLEPNKDMLIKMNGNNLVISVVPIFYLNMLDKVVAIIKKYNNIENKEYKIRNQIIGRGHIAKYHFQDIVGNSDVICKCKKIAKMMAVSDSSVLITGESGTGKELFAQAIHNSSGRKSYRFVAINCAALPENLLESELFGYEEGAFTGAKKGGKIGLFELAHKGTLFLDEIEEMPASLQSRLLRVLEEREVMRVGGRTIISIDVKVIAATNSPLKELVNQGKFRKDLYYRLAVIPLNIPPLRERKVDIPIIANEIIRELNGNFQLSEEVLKRFMNYSWEGNVRELRNYLEYFNYFNKKRIEVEDIPFIYEEDTSVDNLNEVERRCMERLITDAGNKIPKYIFILEQLETSYQNKTRIGRRTILREALANGVFLTENEIRSILINLENQSMVEINIGRGGTVITGYGRKILNYLKNSTG